MKIGIIGSGNMGRTIGLNLYEKGHEVFFGSRNEYDIRNVQHYAKKPVLHGSISEAVDFGDLLLYSLRDVLPSTVATREQWAHKILIDCNNGTVPPDFSFDPVVQSYTEIYQQDLPSTHVVKAFNCSAQEIYNHGPEMLSSHKIMSPIAGNNEPAKQIVSGLIKEMGLQPIDVGTAGQARLLESLADLVRMMMVRNGFGAYMILTAHQLPSASEARFGERQPTKYK